VVCSGEWGAADGQAAEGQGEVPGWQRRAAGGGPSGKAAAAGSSSGEASSSRGEASRPSTLPSTSASHRTPVVVVEVMLDAPSVVHTPPLSGEVVASMCAWQGALTCHIDGVCGCSGESALGAVEKATAEAEKHGDRSEPLAALVAEARTLIEQARAVQAERARVAVEEAAAAAALKAAAQAEAAAERLRVEEEVAALAVRMQSDALRMQQMRAQLGVPLAAPAPRLDAEETLCVLCFDAPKDHIILPCYHACVCEAFANLTQMKNPSCPICRTAIQHTNKVFHS
jgi:hypothetical protein